MSRRRQYGVTGIWWSAFSLESNLEGPEGLKRLIRLTEIYIFF